ncbi:MAG TPA: transposase [Bacillota bacterium]|nr:transposase [Bacillota bacterium]
MFSRSQGSEQALLVALMEMVVNEVSTPEVSQIAKELCDIKSSKGTMFAV